MMTLDAVRELIMEARRNEAAAPPFPSGVAATDNRAGFLSASEAGRCSRWLWYVKHGVAVAGENPSPYGVFDRGHAFELWATTYLAAGLVRAGGSLLYAGTEQKRLMLPDFRLAGTPDGLIEWPDRAESVLEVKSHGSTQNYDNGPSEMHVRQTELNIELFHETTAHRPEDGIIIYGLAEDYGRLALHRVERRPAVFTEMLGKAAAAFDASNAAAVTPEGVVTKQCVICPYRSRCAAAQAAAIPAAGSGDLDPAALRSIDRLVHAHRRAFEAEEEAARARAEVEAEIVATLSDAGSRRIKRNGYAVQVKTPKDGEAVLESLRLKGERARAPGPKPSEGSLKSSALARKDRDYATTSPEERYPRLAHRWTIDRGFHPRLYGELAAHACRGRQRHHRRGLSRLRRHQWGVEA